MIPCHHNIVRIVSCNYNVIDSNFDFYAHHKKLLNISFNVISHFVSLSLGYFFSAVNFFVVCLACKWQQKRVKHEKRYFQQSVSRVHSKLIIKALSFFVPVSHTRTMTMKITARTFSLIGVNWCFLISLSLLTIKMRLDGQSAFRKSLCRFSSSSSVASK